MITNFQYQASFFISENKNALKNSGASDKFHHQITIASTMYMSTSNDYKVSVSGALLPFGEQVLESKIVPSTNIMS